MVRLGRDQRALAQLQHRLLRRRPVAAGAGDEERSCAGAGLAAPRAPPRRRPASHDDVLAAQRRDRRDRARVARGVAPALLDLRRADDDLVARARRAASSRAPGDEPLRPGERPRRLERQRRLALVRDARRAGRRPAARARASSACTASPPVCAAWNDVPQPGEEDPRALRQPPVASAPARSHSGCAAIARASVSPGISRSSIPSRAMAVVRAPDARQRAARPDRAAAARPVGRLLRHARRRLALRDAPRRTASRTSPSTCSSRAPSGGPSARDITTRDRRRSAASSTPSPARSTRATTSAAPARAPRHRARRARRHAPPLEVRRRGDRAREGRDPRGDEHVLRHAARLHRRASTRS